MCGTRKQHISTETTAKCIQKWLLVKCVALMLFLADSVMLLMSPSLSCINLSTFNQCSERERERTEGKKSLFLQIDYVAEYLSSIKGYLYFKVFTYHFAIDIFYWNEMIAYLHAICMKLSDTLLWKGFALIPLPGRRRCLMWVLCPVSPHWTTGVISAKRLGEKRLCKVCLLDFKQLGLWPEHGSD